MEIKIDSKRTMKYVRELEAKFQEEARRIFTPDNPVSEIGGLIITVAEKAAANLISIAVTDMANQINEQLKLRGLISGHDVKHYDQVVTDAVEQTKKKEVGIECN